MIDKDGNILPKEKKLKKLYLIIKENTAQIAITIPIVMAIYANVINLYSYILERGYYKYFGIDASFMLFDNKIKIYQLILDVALILLYWIYAIFAVEMFRLKRNIFWKIVCFVIIPIGINIMGCSIYGLDISCTLIVVCIIFILFHWYLIFAWGYCMITPFPHKRKIKNGNKKKEGDGVKYTIDYWDV